MVLVDTSVWVEVFRDASGAARNHLLSAAGEHEIALTRFTQLELLQGCRDDQEWELLNSYLGTQDYLEMRAVSWELAARIYFDLRRNGLAVRSSIDCCIAQVALDHGVPLIHRDGDFETIGTLRELRQVRL